MPDHREVLSVLVWFVFSSFPVSWLLLYEPSENIWWLREENSTYVKPWIILTCRNYLSFTYWATIYSRGSPKSSGCHINPARCQEPSLATLSMNRFTWEFPSGVFLTGGPRKQCWWWTETFRLSAPKVRRVGRETEPCRGWGQGSADLQCRSELGGAQGSSPRVSFQSG